MRAIFALGSALAVEGGETIGEKPAIATVEPGRDCVMSALVVAGKAPPLIDGRNGAAYEVELSDPVILVIALLTMPGGGLLTAGPKV